MEGILIAVITGGISLLGTIITVIATTNKQQTTIETRLAVIDERITHLKNSVDKHNGFAERMPVVEEQIKVVNHRIADLEHEVQRA